MLQLQKIVLTHFKNYDIQTFDFHSKLVGICGKNGVGKTNLIDSIYYSCFTKSYFTASDNLNIGFDKDGFRLDATFYNDQQPNRIVCMLKPNTKKEMVLNDVPYAKLSQHIGLLPCVMIAPDDIEMINGGSESRRKLIDALISQLDTTYLQQLISYNKIMQQRNSLLKSSREKGKLDVTLLDILDTQMIEPANYIFEKRTIYCKTLVETAFHFYNEIAKSHDNIRITYESQLSNQPMQLLLKNSRDKDFILLRTNAGIHKDDLQFLSDGQPFKSIASQGQKKSLLFALKLAEYEIIKNAKGFSPILLLDDVFEKLDEDRMNNLLLHVCKRNDGQVFITDTHKDRLEKSFSQLDIPHQIIELTSRD
jgi:DNA replication and repair protein RecF